MIEELAGPRILFIEDVKHEVEPIMNVLDRKEMNNIFIDARPEVAKPNEPIKSAELVFLDLHFSQGTMAQFDADICAGLVQQSVPEGKQYYLVIFSRDIHRAEEVVRVLEQIGLTPIKMIVKQKNEYDFNKESEVERLLNEIDDEFERVQQIDEVYAQVLAIEEDEVVIDCLINKEEKIFQTRYINILPLSNMDLAEGKFLFIKTITKLGSIIFEFYPSSEDLSGLFSKDNFFKNIDPNDLIG